MERGAVLAGFVYLGLTLGYLLSTPAFEAPDEADHYRYAFHLSHTGELPVMRGMAAELGRPMVDEAVQAYHPPAYYMLLAMSLRALGHWDTTSIVVRNPEFASDWENPPPGMYLHYLHGADERSPVSPEIGLLRWLRGWSVLFGLVAVLATHRMARLAFPSRPVVADLAALLLACTPKWTAQHAAINNGLPAAALSHLVVLLLALGLSRRRLDLRTGLLCGLLSGLAVMCKLTALFLLPVMFTVWVLAWIRWPDKRRTVVSALAALAVLAGITLPFFLRNVELYGSFMALDVHQLSFPERIRVPVDQRWEWIRQQFLPKVWSSLLGHFGWWVLAPMGWLVTVGQVLAAASGLGWVLHRVHRRKAARGEPEEGADRPVLWLLLGVSLLVYAVTFRYNLLMRGPHARYLFPALGPMAVLFAAGLVWLGDRLGWLAGLRWAAFVTPVTLAGVVLLFQFRPAFDPGLAPADSRHASLVEGLATAPAEPRITLLEPADGAELSAAPRFCWEPPRNDVVDDPVYSLHIYREEGRVLLATYEFFRQEVRDTCLELPGQGWEFIPAGEELLWKVRRVPDRAAGETVADAPESAPFRFTRRAP